MRLNRNLEELNKKCELLMDLGFQIQHRDCDVSFETSKVCLEGFDFSATAPDAQSILYTALVHVYNLGLERGSREVQRQMREVLGIE